MTISNVFGRIVTAAQVEGAATATLRLWMPTYLHELERQLGRTAGSLPAVRSWTTANEFVKWPEEQLPAVVLVSDGIAEEPAKDGTGIFTAVWSLGVGVVCSAATREASNELVKLYAAAVRAVLVQKRSLGGFATNVVWLGESYDDVPQKLLRMAAVAEVEFVVTVDEALALYGGPPVPDDDPDPLGEVEEVDIDALPSRADTTDPPDLMHLVTRRAP